MSIGGVGFLALMLARQAAAKAAARGVSLTMARILRKRRVKELKAMLIGWIVEEAAGRAGLQLDPNDPFSDASMAGAVGARVGIPLRSLRDQAMVIEDIDAFLAARVSEKSGYTVRSVRDVEKLKEDLRRIGAALVTERIGLPVGIIPENGDWEGDVIKARILEWAKAEVLNQASLRVGSEIASIQALGDFEALAGEINGRLSEIGSLQQVDARNIALGIANKLASEAVAGYQKTVKVLTKRARRQELNRAAQAKFRARHGNRQQYVPLGMVATVE